MYNEGRPDSARHCYDCDTPGGLRLQNTLRTAPVHIPLLYVCARCGIMLTVPPSRSPVEGDVPETIVLSRR